MSPLTPSPRPKAVVLLSGGIDSATCLAIAHAEGFAPHALSFRYGQRHVYELHAARRVADAGHAVDSRTIEMDLRQIGGSALTGDLPLPTDRTTAQMNSSVAPTYVPARNTIFLSYALAWAEVLGAGDIFIGVNAADHAGYPDCRPEYIRAYETMANLATRFGTEGTHALRIHAPLIAMSKAQIIRRGLDLGVDFGLTSTCYDPSDDGRACGHCDACLVRLEAFRELGVADPVPYRGDRAIPGRG